MSGEVAITREGKWVVLTLRQNIRRSIAVQRFEKPDGTVEVRGGPGEYFARVKLRFDERLDAAMPHVDALMAEQRENLGLVSVSVEKKGTRRQEASSTKSRDKIEITFWATKRLKREERTALADSLQAVVDATNP